MELNNELVTLAASPIPDVAEASAGVLPILPTQATPPQVPEYDGRFFAWVNVQQCWAVPKPTPQLIIDVDMFKYKQSVLSNQGVVTIVSQHPLSIEEYDLTLSDLAKRYPWPPHPIVVTDNGEL